MTTPYALWAGQATPTSDKAHGANAGQVGDRESEHADFAADGLADQAALRIEGEQYAAAYLARLQDETADPCELAVIVAFLRGEMLAGFCRVVQKVLSGTRHA